MDLYGWGEREGKINVRESFEFVKDELRRGKEERRKRGRRGKEEENTD